MSKNDYVIEKKKNPFFTIVKIAIIITILISMIGLENSVNTNNLCFANIIGLDKSENNPSNLLVTFQIITPKMESSNSVSTDKTLVTSIDENSIDIAVSTLQDYISSNIEFSNSNAIIISEDLAKDGVQRYISTISSNLEFNNNMYILICEGKAQDFIETLDKNDSINPTSYFDILKNAEEKSSSVKFVNLTEFSNLLFTSNATPYAPICKINTENKENSNENQDNKDTKDENEQKSESSASKKDSNTVDNTSSNNQDLIKQKSDINIEIGGTAIFKDEKLVGKISSDETAFHIMLTSILKSYTTTLDVSESEDNAINNQTSSSNVNITQTGKAKIKVDTNGNRPRIDVKIPLNIVVLDTPAGEYDYLNSNYISSVKKKVTEVLDKKMENYINKIQKEYNTDLAEFYKYSRKNFLTAKEYNEYNFKEKFKDAKIDVRFDITFNDAGLNLEK